MSLRSLCLFSSVLLLCGLPRLTGDCWGVAAASQSYTATSLPSWTQGQVLQWARDTLKDHSSSAIEQAVNALRSHSVAGPELLSVFETECMGGYGKGDYWPQLGVDSYGVRHRLATALERIIDEQGVDHRCHHGWSPFAFRFSLNPFKLAWRLASSGLWLVWALFDLVGLGVIISMLTPKPRTPWFEAVEHAEQQLSSLSITSTALAAIKEIKQGLDSGKPLIPAVQQFVMSHSSTFLVRAVGLLISYSGLLTIVYCALSLYHLAAAAPAIGVGLLGLLVSRLVFPISLFNALMWLVWRVGDVGCLVLVWRFTAARLATLNKLLHAVTGVGSNAASTSTANVDTVSSKKE